MEYQDAILALFHEALDAYEDDGYRICAELVDPTTRYGYVDDSSWPIVQALLQAGWRPPLPEAGMYAVPRRPAGWSEAS